MTQSQRSVAELKILVKNLPEFFHISARETCNVWEVDGNNALIETTIIFMLSWYIVASVRNVSYAFICETIWR